MKIQPQQICLVDFDPSVGYEIQKVRPALVIGNDTEIKKNKLIPVVPITTREYGKNEYEIVLKKDEKNKLFKDSLVLANQLYTYDKKRFQKVIGTIAEQDYRKVMIYLKKLLRI